MSRRGFALLVLAFLGTALVGAWHWAAGLVLGLASAVLFWRAHYSGGLDRLRRHMRRLGDGDFGARLEAGKGWAQEALGPDLEAMALGLGKRFAAAEELRRRLMAAINGMSEGVALCDELGAVLLINPAFRRLAGFERTLERRYFLWEAVRDPDLNAAVDAALKRAVSSRVDLPLDQGRVEGRALVAPVEAPAGGPGAGAVVFLFDRTEERRVERLRTEFVANVSHELRTPLSAIKAALETLRDGALSDAAVNQAFLQKAIHHSERLEELLNDLLSLSQIEEQRRRGLGPREASCKVAEAMADAEGSLEAALGRNPGALSVELPADLPAVAMERGSLSRILVNYIENALKYSGPEPKVAVGARRDGASVELWVKDQGQGIPETDLPRVFERFFRVEKARTRVGGGGSGLGLSIVKHLAENAGAQVGAESRWGQGSRFWVRLKAVGP